MMFNVVVYNVKFVCTYIQNVQAKVMFGGLLLFELLLLLQKYVFFFLFFFYINSMVYSEDSQILKYAFIIHIHEIHYVLICQTI